MLIQWHWRNFGQELGPTVVCITSLQTHWAPNGTFVFTFPTTQHFTPALHYFIHHFPFSFSQTHSTATTEAQLSADQHLQHSSVNRFCFRWDPYSAPPICWVLFWYFLFFPCSSIFLCCVYWDLEEWLWMLVYFSSAGSQISLQQTHSAAMGLLLNTGLWLWRKRPWRRSVYTGRRKLSKTQRFN